MDWLREGSTDRRFTHWSCVLFVQFLNRVREKKKERKTRLFSILKIKTVMGWADNKKYWA